MTDPTPIGNGSSTYAPHFVRTTADNLLDALHTSQVHVREANTDPSSDPRQSTDYMKTENLYPVTELEVTLPISRSVSLLRLCIDDTEAAIASHKDGDLVSADDLMLRLKGRLPELFCLRTIGDGFGGLISSIQNAYLNQPTIPFNLIQIRAIKKTLAALREAPRMSFDAAMELMEELESTGLLIDPPGFVELLEDIDV